jgi:hypothetical protein
MPSGRQPDYRIAALDKSTDQQQNVGAAWINPDGRISVQFDPFVVLDFRDKNLIISLFPAAGGEGKKKSKPSAAEPSQDDKGPF